MSDYFGVPFPDLCDMLAKAYADKDWTAAERMLAVLKSRVSEARYPDFP